MGGVRLRPGESNHGPTLGRLGSAMGMGTARGQAGMWVHGCPWLDRAHG